MGGHRRHDDNDNHRHNRSRHDHYCSDDETAATGRLTELADIMGRAGRGDGDAVVTLIMEFGAPIGATMRRHLAALGVRHVDADDLQGLVIDACIELGLHGGSWDPARGALPWVWAERQLRMVASRFVGQWADPLDDDASRRGCCARHSTA